MNKGQLFFGIAITFIVILFTINMAKSLSTKHSDFNKTTDHVFAFGVTPSSPARSSDNQQSPEIKTALSYSSLPSALCIRIDQEIAFLFELLFKVENVEIHKPPFPISLNSFFLALFKIIISPNAP